MNPISKHRDILRKKISFVHTKYEKSIATEKSHDSSLAESKHDSDESEHSKSQQLTETKSELSKHTDIESLGNVSESDDEPDSDEEALEKFEKSHTTSKSKSKTKSISATSKETPSKQPSKHGESISEEQELEFEQMTDDDDAEKSEKEAVQTTKSVSPKYKYPIEYNATDEQVNSIPVNTKIYICPFRINNYGYRPFIQYCFYKYPKSENQMVNDLMILMYIRYKGSSKTPIQQTNEFIRHTFGVEKGHSGAIQYNGNYYLFYDFSDFEKESIEQLEKSRSDTWWWCLLDEIINYSRVINFPVFEEHRKLFLENPSLLFLYNRENQKIETPVVGYHGTYYDYKILILTQGLRKSTLYAMMGPYYYFGTFRKSVRYAGWTSTYKMREIDGNPISDAEGRYNRGTIIRFAVFVGEMTALLNHSYEKDDLSGLVRQRLKENPKSQKWEKLTLKLHDHEGTWTEFYDSIYVGKANLSNGKKFMANPEFIVKKFKQQYVLSAHELDKSTLDKNWNNSKTDYNIL